MTGRDEYDILMATFVHMLAKASADGKKKRDAGVKDPWWRDPSHEAGVWSHFKRRAQGELVDPESGAHPFVHAAWRLLAIAYQETYGKRPPTVDGMLRVRLLAQEVSDLD